MKAMKFLSLTLKNNGYDILEKSNVWSEVCENI